MKEKTVFLQRKAQVNSKLEYLVHCCTYVAMTMTYLHDACMREGWLVRQKHSYPPIRIIGRFLMRVKLNMPVVEDNNRDQP